MRTKALEVLSPPSNQDANNILGIIKKMQEDIEPGQIPAIEEFKELSPHAQIQDIKDVDVEITNNLLKVLHASFPSASTIKSACALINTTMKVLAERRKILTIDYANKNNAAPQTPIFPLS